MSNLLDRMNNFDFWYMMSDSNDVYRRESANMAAIKCEVSAMTELELSELIPNLSAKAIEFFKVVAPVAEPGPVAAPLVAKAKNQKLSTIMRTAWSLIRKGIYSTISEALKAAWMKAKLKTALRAGIVHFSFAKADGTIREAIGTLRPGNFKHEYKSGKAADVEQIVKYYDVVCDAFRSCRLDRIINIEIA